jgi:leader peptidase (prepilin peptidase)/N-methyltransferase
MTAAWSRWSSLAAGTAGAGLAGVATALVLSPGEVAASAVLGGAMAVIAAEDVRRLRVPDSVNAFAAIAGLAMIWIEARSTGDDWLAALGAAALAAALCGGALYIVREAFYRLRGFDGLGFGDVKLGATAGIWLGWEEFPFAVLMAATGALAYVLWRTAADGAWPKDRRIPFAAFLAPAIWLCWLLSRRLTAL